MASLSHLCLSNASWGQWELGFLRPTHPLMVGLESSAPNIAACISFPGALQQITKNWVTWQNRPEVQTLGVSKMALPLEALKNNLVFSSSQWLWASFPLWLHYISLSSHSLLLYACAIFRRCPRYKCQIPETLALTTLWSHCTSQSWMADMRLTTAPVGIKSLLLGL